MKNYSILFILFSIVFLSAIAHAGNGYIFSANDDLEWSEPASFTSLGVPSVYSFSAARTSDGISIVSPAESGVLYNSQSTGLWNGWENLGGIAKGSAVSSANGVIYIAIRGGDDALWVNERLSGSWSGWKSLNGSLSADPVVVKTSVGLDAGVKGSDNMLWLIRKYPGGAIGSWHQINGFNISGNMSLAEENGEVLIAARGVDNHVHVITRNVSGIWDPLWSDLGGTFVSDPFIYKLGGIVYVAGVGADNALWYKRRTGGVWGEWTTLGGACSGKPFIAGNEWSTVISVRGSDGGLWFRLLDRSNGTWADWKRAPSGPFTSHAVIEKDNTYNFFVHAVADKQVWRITYYPDKTQTTFDYSYQDYSVRDLSSGGKELSFFLSNPGYKVRLTYTLNPDQAYVTKTFGIAKNDLIKEPINHVQNQGLVYVTIENNRSVFRIGNSLIERSCNVSGGVLQTIEIYNKVSGIRHKVKSDEFGIKFAGNKTAYIDLERISVGESLVWWGAGYGNPSVYDDLFFWIKHPMFIPKVQVTGADQFIVERMYPITPVSNGSYVYGSYEAITWATPSGKALDAFKENLISLNDPGNVFYFPYATWWTADYRVTENQTLAMISELENDLFMPYGVKFDVFRLDDSWTQLNSIWKPDPVNFPNGLGTIASRLSSLGIKLGLWISPSSNYPSQNKTWAEQNNYSVKKPDWIDSRWNLCFYDAPGKKSYYQEIRTTVAGYVTDLGLSHIMFDYYSPCYSYGPEEADNFIEFQIYLRTLNPNIKYELTGAFSPGYIRASNWMLATLDDYPSGIIPSLSYKDSYISTRHQVFIEFLKNTAVPAKLMFPFGIMIQTSDDWHNDAVSNMLMGTPHIPIWIDPKYFDSEDWSYFAGLMKWAKANQRTLLSSTYLLGGEPKNGAVYGFSHYDNLTHEAYILLRNPSINEQDYDLRLDESLGRISEDNYMVKIVYPYRYAYDSAYGLNDSQSIPLKGFETLVLHVMPYSSVKNEILGARYEVVDSGSGKILRIYAEDYSKIRPRILLNGTNPSYQELSIDSCNASSMFKISSSRLAKSADSIGGRFVIQSTANYETKLIILINSTKYFDMYGITDYSFYVDGNNVSSAVTVKTSTVNYNKATRTDDQQWAQESGLEGKPRHSWTYLLLPLPSGAHSVSFNVINLPSGVSSSANIYYTQTLKRMDITPSEWTTDSDEHLKVNNISKITGTIEAGTDKDDPSCGDGVCSCDENGNSCPADCTISATTTTTTTTTLPVQCALKGNNPPCDEVSLQEIVDAINAWAVDEFTLSEVIALINAWAST